MDDLCYLMLDKGFTWTYYNQESFTNLIPRDPDFFGYSYDEVSRTFVYLIEHDMLMPYPGQQFTQNYMLTEKGRAGYLTERQKREEKAKAELLQKSVSESVLRTNNSVVDTNESVRQTNQWVCKMNCVSL